MTTLTITAKGQITLRKELLGHLGVAPGEKVQINMLPGGRMEIRAVKPAGDIDAFIGLLAGKGKKIATIADMNEAIADGWAGRK